MSIVMRYSIAFIIVSLLQGCGKGIDTTTTTVLPTPPGPLHVQLNAQQTYTMGTEAVQLSDSRNFTVPNRVQVVGGLFNCGYVGCNNSVIRALIRINNAIECRYESNNVAAAYMGLLDCNGAPTQYALSSGSTITLVPQYAPGLLLEVSFTLTK